MCCLTLENLCKSTWQVKSSCIQNCDWASHREACLQSPYVEGNLRDEVFILVHGLRGYSSSRHGSRRQLIPLCIPKKQRAMCASAQQVLWLLFPFYLYWVLSPYPVWFFPHHIHYGMCVPTYTEKIILKITKNCAQDNNWNTAL